MPVVEPTIVFTDPEPTCQFDMDPDPTVLCSHAQFTDRYTTGLGADVNLEVIFVKSFK